MKLALQVVQHRVNSWTDRKTGQDRFEHVLLGVDVDVQGGEMLETMCQASIPKEQQPKFPPGQLIGKRVDLGVSRIVTMGGSVKFIGKVLSVEGKPVEAAS